MSRSTTWTVDQVTEYAKRQNKTGVIRVRPEQPERPPIEPLDTALAREAPCFSRAEIVFTVYSVRPLDWDNYYFKPLQDLLIKAGLLAGDQWFQLEGRVRSRQVATEEEERTQVEIFELEPHDPASLPQ